VLVGTTSGVYTADAKTLHLRDFDEALPKSNGLQETGIEAYRYELSGDTVASIRARFGLSVHDLRQRRVAERWTARPQVARTGPLPMPLRRLAVGSEAIEFRLNRLLILGIALLEKRLAEEGLTDANARTLTELCRAEESRMRTTRQKTGKTRETKNHDAGHDFRSSAG